MNDAVRAVAAGSSLRKTAANTGINYRTLQRYVKHYKDTGEFADVGYKQPRLVFNDVQESQLADYLKQAARIYYGLTTHDFRELAFKYAKANNLNIPEPWNTTEEAGIDWMKCFLKRHPDIALRTPEATSIQRLTNFNQYNVNMFFDNLQQCLERGFTPDCVWNVDETCVTTVQKPKRVLAETGVKQVSSVVSQERGTLVTLCCAVNAIGNSIPPYFVFPRVHVQNHWLLTAPPGSQMSGHPKATGWMTSENFLLFMQHFVNYAKPSEEHKILLILDNHQSHVIDYAKENNITLLSFPPHCSHEMQPLDKSVYGPMKAFFNQAADRWLREKDNAGKSMTIHHIPGLVAYAYPKAMTPCNITAGFKATGIYPFDRNIFGPEKFLPSLTIDKTPPGSTAGSVDVAGTSGNNQPIAGPSKEKEIVPEASEPSEAENDSMDQEHEANSPQPRLDDSGEYMLLSPEEIRPFGKAAPKKGPTRKKQIPLLRRHSKQKLRQRSNPKGSYHAKLRKHLICNQVTRNLRVILAVRKKLILPSFAMILVMILVMMKAT